MATTITMPQLGETVTEGTVAQWLKKPGDRIEKYEAFVEVSTDKVNAEVPAPVSGILREIIVQEGETVPTGAAIAVIDEVGAPANAEPVADAIMATPATAVHTAAPPQSVTKTNGVSRSDTSLRGVSPAVRKLAREHNVDVTSIRGTGANGRITAQDILDASRGVASPAPATAPRTPSAPSDGRSSYTNPIPGTTIPLTQARKIIAQRMVESRHTAPHAWTMVEVDVTNLWTWRTREKDAFERENG